MIILDNISGHKGDGAARSLREIEAGLLFPPPYNPELCLIERAFSKLKAPIAKSAASPCNNFWQAVSHVSDLLGEGERYNFFDAARFDGD